MASLLTLNKDYAAKLMFQAKVNKSYLDYGIGFNTSAKQPRVPKDVIECATEFIYHIVTKTSAD